MSTSYFVLAKPMNNAVDNNEANQIISLNGSVSYILPRNLITYYCERGLFESGLIEWCKQFCGPDKIMLDIGAHTGTYALSLASKSKLVYAFEPQKMTFYALCGGVALSNHQNVMCCNFGLGSEDQVGENILNIVSNDGGGSSLHVPESGSVLREETICIKTLDSMGLKDIGFIKMDVEDNELFVLEGGRETLKQSGFPPILFECNDKERNIALFELLGLLSYKVISVTGANNMYLACH